MENLIEPSSEIPTLTHEQDSAQWGEFFRCLEESNREIGGMKTNLNYFVTKSNI